MYVTKIKVNGKIIELTDCCTWGVKEGVLYNNNTHRDEGVEGDIVRYKSCKTYYEGHVKGYTCGQIITTEEYGTVCLSANDLPACYIHNTKVEPV
jgi:hypothetical protein